MKVLRFEFCTRRFYKLKLTGSICMSTVVRALKRGIAIALGVVEPNYFVTHFIVRFK